MTKANASSWPDSPLDQICSSGDTCNNNSPTFWSSKELTDVTTRYWNGSGYTNVDSYDFTYQFPNSGDPDLWLATITRTGWGADGSKITMPSIQTKGQVMDNRVAAYLSRPPMSHWRVTGIITDTGEVIGVTYTGTQCSATNVPSDPSTNGMRCFPAYWTWPGDKDPTLDWFHKYLVSQVTVQDSSGYAPAQVTGYTYVGNPAWHYDDNELTKPAQRTYGQFRGYQEVDISTGDPTTSDPITLEKTIYFRGMNGDTLPGGGTRSATVPDSLGETVPDSNQFAGSARETQGFTGAGGTLDHASISDMAIIAVTATRARTGLPALTATMVRSTGVRTRQAAPAAAGGWTHSAQTSAYDSVGRLADITATADGQPTTCTRTVYANNTTSWIRDHVAESSSAPGACPAVGATLSGIISDVQTFYDGSGTFGAVTGAGDATTTKHASANNGGTLSFLQTATAGYDPAGRLVSSADALGHSTTLSYTPDLTGNPAISAGPLTQIVTKNPLGQSTTEALDPGRGYKTSTTDIAGHVTTAAYDQLGRVTAVFQPGIAQAASTYSYQWQTSGPLAVTSKQFVDYGTGTNYVTSISLYDSLGQLRQTQADAKGGGRVVSDTMYDSHGWAVKSNSTYYTTGAPSAAAILTTADNQVPDQTRTTYDAMGRVAVSTEYSNGNPTWHTSTAYGGDRTTVIPPAGATPTTTIVDTAGRTVELDQYTAPPTVNGNTVTGGVYQATKYSYDNLGNLTNVTDPAGDRWTFGYDFLGRKHTQTNPDTGASTYNYYDDGSLSSVSDANNNTLAYTYDAVGRKTAEYQNSTSGTKLASWVYDTLQAGKPTSAIRWVGTNAYVVAATGYDGRGRPTGTKTIIPAVETGLAGTYTTSTTYTNTDQVSSVAPAKVGGLPLETLNYTYDTMGSPLSATGYSFTVNGTAYTPYGEVAQFSLGTSNSQAWLSFGYDYQTRRTTDINTSAQTATSQLDDTSYSYDPAGNVTKISDVQGPAGSATDTQCFSYDPLRRMTGAWTATDNCAATPASGSSAMVGGPNPYWTTWSFDSLGDRTGQTQHGLSGSADTTSTYNYPAPGANVVRPHAVTSVNASGPGAVSTGYSYDNIGNTLTRTGVPGGDQSLSWDTEEHLTKISNTAGATTFLYDADGNQLIRRDPGKSTLYLPGEELTYSTSGAKTGTRYYSFDGGTLGEAIDGAAPIYLTGDPHGTNSLAVNSSTFAATRRSFDPYGNARGTGTGTWPDSHGFLNAPVEATTGLTDIGARKYDPTTGRFISDDPVLDLGNPQQMAGYLYAGNNPAAFADPTGLDWWDDFTNVVSNTVDDLQPIYDPLGFTIETVWDPSSTQNAQDFWSGVGEQAGNFLWQTTNLLDTNAPGHDDAVQNMKKSAATDLNRAADDAADGDYLGATAHLINQVVPVVTAGTAVKNTIKDLAHNDNKQAGKDAFTAAVTTTAVVTTVIAPFKGVFSKGAGADAAVDATRAVVNDVPKQTPQQLLASIAEPGKTAGVLDLNGELTPLISGKGELPNYAASGHVEGQAAMIMRAKQATSATLYIDNPSGICGYCTSQVPTLLPEGATLDVVTPLGTVELTSRWSASKIFTGNARNPKGWTGP